MQNNMCRRRTGHDYYGRGIYMITIATDNRRPLLGRLVCPQEEYCNSFDAAQDCQELSKGQSGSVGRGLSPSVKPFVKLSAIGRAVADAWRGMAFHYPQIDVEELQIMPDHIHGILFVKEEMLIHLGNVIGSFKFQSMKSVMKMLKNGTVSIPSIRTDEDMASFRLWEPSYHDRLLSGAGQLRKMIDYVHDNPRRLYLKKLKSDYFRQFEYDLNGRRVKAIGNKGLLQAQERIAVRCSRRMSDEEVEKECIRLMERGCDGAVLVSPFISPGERRIGNEAVERGVCVIKIMQNGFGEYYKPGGVLFDACAEGRLLLIAPYDYSSFKIELTREKCEDMNGLAKMITEV